MDENLTTAHLSRRSLLKFGSIGLLGLASGSTLRDHAAAQSAIPARGTLAAQAQAASRFDIHLAGTDGHILLPGRGSPSGPGGDPVYVFGFVRVPVGATANELDVYKGVVQNPAPMIGVDQEADVYLTMTNIGLVVRPDLDDSHTIHWHGFPNATSIFDGVPEVSISVPVGRGFPYYYRPHRAGTFMYHCHFEDVEHVQMGMQGVVYVRPAQNGSSIGGFTKFAYNDGDGSTGYDREFAMMVNDTWTRPHDNLESIQETVWPNYAANYWTFNARSYPDTLARNNDPAFPEQPLSSLMQVNATERVLMRFASLGYEQQALQLPGIRMRVVGEDATFLHNGSVDLSYLTNTLYIGPGEAKDVLFTAPAFNPDPAFVEQDTSFDPPKPYNVYQLKNRDVHKLTNNGLPGLGGQVTEVWVYENGALPEQTHANETYPEFPPSSPYLNPWIVSP